MHDKTVAHFELLSAKLSYKFTSLHLLAQALTHRSYSANNNERLEFLGDGVLNFIVAHQLYSRFPDLPEGDLSRLRAQLVREETLATIAVELNIGEQLKLGEGEVKSGGWKRPSVLSDALEAIFGAAYLDGGFAAAEIIVLQLYSDLLQKIDPKLIGKDAKSLLQEYLQGKKIELPNYEVMEIIGEAHAQTFKVSCDIARLNITTNGTGSSRRNAEQQAAEAAFELIIKK